MRLKSCWIDDVPVRLASEKLTCLRADGPSGGESVPVHMGWALEASALGILARKEGFAPVLVPWTRVLSAEVVDEPAAPAVQVKK